MSILQCMIVAAILVAIGVVVKHASLYWRYLKYISALKAWQEIFKIKACHLEDAEKCLYRYEFDNDDSISDDIRQLIVQRIDVLGKSGVMQIVKPENSERLVVCFVKESLKEILSDYLEKAKRLLYEYQKESSFVQSWMKKENDKLTELYGDLATKYEQITKRSGGKLVTFFEKG